LVIFIAAILKQARGLGVDLEVGIYLDGAQTRRIYVFYQLLSPSVDKAVYGKAEQILKFVFRRPKK
jgi:hypothetical protein